MTGASAAGGRPRRSPPSPRSSAAPAWRSRPRIRSTRPRRLSPRSAPTRTRRAGASPFARRRSPSTTRHARPARATPREAAPGDAAQAPLRPSRPPAAAARRRSAARRPRPRRADGAAPALGPSSATTTPRSTRGASTPRGPRSPPPSVAAFGGLAHWRAGYARTVSSRPRDLVVAMQRRDRHGRSTGCSHATAGLRRLATVQRDVAAPARVGHVERGRPARHARSAPRAAVENVDDIDTEVMPGRRARSTRSCVLRGPGRAGPSLDGVPPSVVRSHARRTTVAFVTAARILTVYRRYHFLDA